MAHVIYQADQHKLTPRHPTGKKGDTPTLIQGIKAPFTERNQKEKKMRSSNSKSNPESLFTIPIRVNISLRIPPPSPNVPCVTPDELSDERDEIKERISQLQNRHRSPSIHSKSSWNSSFRSQSVRSMWQSRSKRSLKNLDVLRSNQSNNRSQSAKPKRYPQSSSNKGKQFRSSTSSQSVAKRKQASIIGMQWGFPEEELQVRKCLQYEHKNTEKCSFKVRKSDNAFVMVPNESVKKCIVYIPCFNKEPAFGKSLEIREYEIIDVNPKEKLKYANKHKKLNSVNPVDTVTEKIIPVPKRIETFKKQGSRNVKQFTKMVRQASLSKIANQNEVRKTIYNNFSGDDLLPQNQHKNVKQITMSDVLLSLNSLNRKQSSHNELKKEVKNKGSFPSKPNPEIWERPRHTSNNLISYQTQLFKKTCKVKYRAAENYKA